MVKTLLESCDYKTWNKKFRNVAAVLSPSPSRVPTFWFDWPVRDRADSASLSHLYSPALHSPSSL